jgi:hypothetical protein
MSTRANIHFTDRTGQVAANIYRHSDGYPEGVLPDLEKFFDAVEAQVPNDTRFGDPEYLAAKFVVWQAWENAGILASDPLQVAPLAFLSVGVTTEDAGDGEYVYTVTCHGDGRPKVTYREA